MIQVIGRHLRVPENEKSLGFVSDHFVETRIFKITDSVLFPFSFKLELENGAFVNICDLDRVQEGDALLLTWNISAACLQSAGPLYAQLRAFRGYEAVWHSDIAQFSLFSSINAEAYLPPVMPTEFAEMEGRMTALKEESAASARSAEKAKEEAETLPRVCGDFALECEASFHRAAEAAIGAGNAFSACKTAEENAKKAKEDALGLAHNAYESAVLAKTYAQSAEEYAGKILAQFGNMENALDAIYALELSYIGGGAN